MWTIIGAVAITLLSVLLAPNCQKSEQQIERRVEHLHDIANPQYQRAMSVLMGPAIVPGNHVVALCNGYGLASLEIRGPFRAGTVHASIALPFMGG
jgi:hypothetical protein